MVAKLGFGKGTVVKGGNAWIQAGKGMVTDGGKARI